MPNPLFNALGGTQNATPPMLQQFRQFMEQMRGKDPNAMIQELVSSGRVSQQQLDQAQQQAQQIANTFQSIPGFSNKL